MSWAVGFDSRWNRDIGYGVPGTCDHPGCGAAIWRGLSEVCAFERPRGGEEGCGLYFCGEHLAGQCERCKAEEPPFEPTPDTREWIEHKLSDESWGPWRDEHPAEVTAMAAAVAR